MLGPHIPNVRNRDRQSRAHVGLAAGQNDLICAAALLSREATADVHNQAAPCTF
jgi:hypothetical protein